MLLPKRISLVTVLFLITSILGSLALAQDTLYLPKISQKLDKEKYYDVKGTQYLYDEWLPSEVLLSNGSTENIKLINFNGYSTELELKDGSDIREIPAFAYIKVKVDNNGLENVFLRGIHPEFRGDLVCMMYEGSNVKLGLRFVVKLEEISEPNAITKKFIRRNEYYLITGNKIDAIILKKKKVLASLQQKGLDLEAYIDKNNLKLKTEEEVIQLLKYYDSQLNK